MNAQQKAEARRHPALSHAPLRYWEKASDKTSDADFLWALGRAGRGAIITGTGWPPVPAAPQAGTHLNLPFIPYAERLATSRGLA
jgi:hypothetical protein